MLNLLKNHLYQIEFKAYYSQFFMRYCWFKAFWPEENIYIFEDTDGVTWMVKENDLTFIAEIDPTIAEMEPSLFNYGLGK